MPTFLRAAGNQETLESYTLTRDTYEPDLIWVSCPSCHEHYFYDQNKSPFQGDARRRSVDDAIRDLTKVLKAECQQHPRHHDYIPV